MKIRTLIIEDELPSRRRLARFLSRDPRIELVGEARDGLEAVRKIEEIRPDLVFLDIQMPGLNGFEVLEALHGQRPCVIFTTAYDQYAIQAFEVRALDYLLKPFEEDRLKEAIERAVGEVGDRAARESRIDELLDEVRRRQPLLSRILLRRAGRIAFIETREISRISAEEKYVRLYVGGKTYLHRDALQSLESRLDPSRFVRVHRGEILNMEFIRELRPVGHGDYVILLRDGTQVPLGRTFRESFFARFTGGGVP
ncbi:MAG: LytTR family DNA-binding domain-containing protein [Acidobacteriota bacterium]